MDKVKGTSIWIPISLKEKLEGLKKHRREPVWEVIQRLLEVNKNV